MSELKLKASHKTRLRPSSYRHAFGIFFVSLSFFVYRSCIIFRLIILLTLDVFMFLVFADSGCYLWIRDSAAVINLLLHTMISMISEIGRAHV